MTTTPHTGLTQLFQDVFDTPVGEREQIIEHILREHRGAFLHMARRLASAFNIGSDWFDEVAQIVQVETWKYLSRPLKTGYDAAATLPCVRVAARAEVSRMVQSSAYTGISGAVMVRRRKSALEKHRLFLLRTLTREVSDEELVASYNGRVMVTRSRALDQGALATLADLSPPQAHPEAEFDPGRSGAAAETTSEVEVRSLVAEVLTRCADGSESLGAVANAILAQHMQDAPGEGDWTAAEVAAAVGMPRTEVSRLIQRVRQTAAQVLDEWSQTG